MVLTRILRIAPPARLTERSHAFAATNAAFVPNAAAQPRLKAAAKQRLEGVG